jgi:hypothetical protein
MIRIEPLLGSLKNTEYVNDHKIVSINGCKTDKTGVVLTQMLDHIKALTEMVGDLQAQIVLKQDIQF